MHWTSPTPPNQEQQQEAQSILVPELPVYCKLRFACPLHNFCWLHLPDSLPSAWISAPGREHHSPKPLAFCTLNAYDQLAATLIRPAITTGLARATELLAIVAHSTPVLLTVEAQPAYPLWLLDSSAWE